MIPPELSGLKGLREITLAGNQLKGRIPPELGNLPWLQHLSLDRNQLEGSIPPELGSLLRLEYLSLDHNQLNGSIPAELGNLEYLRTLELSRNLFTGDIFQQLKGFPRLASLSLGKNSFTGTVPSGLPELPKVRTLDISWNNFVGCVPADLRNIHIWIVPMRFCDEPLLVQTNRPVLKGGIDLRVTYIERLPRYQKYQLAYFRDGNCRYPFNEFRGPVLCPGQADLKRWPDPEEPIELTAYVWNFGNSASGPFDYEWKLNDETLEVGRHGGLESGKYAEFTLLTEWPDEESNPTVTFAIDTQNEIEELIEDNNVVVDWIMGYTLGFYFSPVAYESLTLSTKVGAKFQSPEHWVHRNITRLNEMLAEAGLEERVRAELLYITDRHMLDQGHELQWFMDGWWGIWDKDQYSGRPVGHFNLSSYTERPDIDYGLLHELLHQLGVIDLYRLYVGAPHVLLPDANRPDQKAGCGTDYWTSEQECFRLPEGIIDLMGAGPHIVGSHTAGGLKANTGHRRGFYGEYLYDTPNTTVVRIVDKGNNELPNVTLRIYQVEFQQGTQVQDAVPEFTLTTDASGSVVLPNRGITGIVTATGHQLRPNPFGVIDVVGTNGTFLIEMEGACTNYEWLTIVELNLAYWHGDTDEAVFTKTLRCPPP